MRDYKRLIPFLRPYLPQIVATWCCTVLVTATTLLIAPLAGNAFQAIGAKDLSLLNLTALSIIGLYAVKGLFTYGQEYLSYLVTNKVVVDLRVRLYEHLQGLSLDFYGRWHSGELLSRMMNDITNLQLTIVTSFTAIIPQSLLLIGLLVYIFILNWQLSLLTLVSLPLIVQLMRWFAAGLRRISEQVQQKTADITAHVQETVSQIRVVKSFTMERKETAKFRAENRKALGISMGAVQILATQSPVIALLQASAAVGIVWLGGLQIINGQLTLPQLIAFATALGIMTDPGSTLSKAFAIIAQGSASIHRIFELLDTQPSVTERPDAQPLREVLGRINFENVAFAYDQKPVLAAINLNVRAGESIALVGRTGAGKSTLVNLIPRFYDPTAGRLVIDGTDIRDVTLESLRRQIAFVPQEIALFRGTIQDNIAYGKPDATGPEIEAAARAANAHQFISALPDGYLTEVGERGAKLSGGEKQRIAIARAVLRDPKILILDEATSSLDAETEVLVREALDKLMQGRTTFIIAHRLYTVEHVDRVIVLDAGRIVEEGKHQELVSRGGLYQKLYEIQFQNK
ncbi:MAG: ABC transporter ATP-binding protein/permease [Candidatus Margulisbacteria bacterium]|nr:ABC transporter ATP-binding protein/permease [Candidatus Margulisiibacteriota bacterium]